MARKNLVLQMVALSVALLTGCIGDSTDDADRASDDVDLSGHWSVQGKDGLTIGGYVNDQKKEVGDDDGPKVKLPTPSKLDEEIGDDLDEPVDDEASGQISTPIVVDKSPIPKTDPQPDPQIVKTVDGLRILDPQPEPRTPGGDRDEKESSDE